MALELADPEFGTPGAIDLLLGTEVFGKVVLNGRRFGPRGSPSALKTHFGWVLGGVVDSEGQRDSETCCLTTTADPLGKTRALAVKRFCSLVRSNGKFDAFEEDRNEYFEQTHAERMPPRDLSKPCHKVYYLPMHAVHTCKNTSDEATHRF